MPSDDVTADQTTAPVPEAAAKPASTLDAAAGKQDAASPAKAEAASSVEAPASKEPSAAQKKLAELRAHRQAKAAAKATPSDLAPEVAAKVAAWDAYEQSEAKRIEADAKTLDEADRALLEGERDITRRALLLKRLLAAAAPVEPTKKNVGKAPPGLDAQPSVKTDFAAALTDPRALDDVKATDPKGWSEYFSRLRSGGRRVSTLNAAPSSR